MEKYMPQQPRGVLWDMDGTLIDSREYHWISWRDTLAEENYELTYEEFAATFGQRNDMILRGYFGEDLPKEEIDRISDAKEEFYRELVRTQGIELLPGAQHWLDYLHNNGWRQAVASSAPRQNLFTIVETMGIGHYFGAIIGAEDVQQGKPDPQVFLQAAQGIDTPPQRCVVIEDSPAGIEAGRRGNMHTIGVRTTHDDLEAETVAATLDQLPGDIFERLVPPAD
jgi:HAD superfamily hydrolase (TIGR01509 family)